MAPEQEQPEQEQCRPNHDLPRKPKSGFAREKTKRLAAEARAVKAETELRELEAAMSDIEQIETQEPEQEQLTPSSPIGRGRGMAAYV
jgi:hypothetical protein